MASRGDLSAGKSFVTLYLKKGAFEKGLLSASQTMKSFGSGLTSVGMKMMAGGSALVAGMTALAHEFTSAGDAATRMAMRTGMTAESITQLSSAAGMNDIAIEAVETGFKKFQKTLSEAAGGSKEATKHLSALGLSVADLEKLHPDQQFELILESLGKIPDPANKTAAAMGVLGKSGTALLPMAGNIKALKQQAIDLGVAMDATAIQSAVEMDDALDTLKGSAVGLSRSIGSALAPMLTELAKVTTACVSALSKFMREHGETTRAIFKGAAALVAGGAAAVVFGKMLIVAGGALAMMTTPLGLATGLIVGGVAAWMKWSVSGRNAAGRVGQAFSEMGDTFNTTWQSVVDAVSAGDLATAGEVAWAGLQLIWQQGTADLQKMWLNTKWYFLTVWGEATTGIAKAFYAVLGELEKAWVNTATFFKTVWNSVSTFVLKAQSSWGTSIGLSIADALESTGLNKKEDVDRFRDVLRRQNEARQEVLSVDSGEFQSKLDSESKARTDAINARTAGLSKILDEDKNRNQKGIDEAFNQSIAGKQKDLADARARLAEIKKKTDAMAAGKIVGGEAGDPGEELAKRGGGVAGSFFAAALGGLAGGGGGKTQEKMAEDIKEQRKTQKALLDVTREMLQAVKDGGMVFAP